MFVEQPVTADGAFVVDAERSIKARVQLPYKNIKDEDEIAHLISVTHPKWELLTPIDGRYFGFKREMVPLGRDEWKMEVTCEPDARIELAFGRLIGMVSEPDEDGIFILPADEEILPSDIAQIVADAACALWKTRHFNRNSGWNGG